MRLSGKHKLEKVRENVMEIMFLQKRFIYESFAFSLRDIFFLSLYILPERLPTRLFFETLVYLYLHELSIKEKERESYSIDVCFMY